MSLSGRMWMRENFLPNFDRVRRLCDTAQFTDMVSPVDGVTYPHINTAIPELCRDSLIASLSEVIGTPVRLNYLFMRLSPEGVRVPHQAHTDATMGRYSAMIYLNYRIHCQGGTSILRHVSGTLDEHPDDCGDGLLWGADCNSPEKWEVLAECPMRPNRAFIFDSRLFHRAEPIGGFGRDPRNARLAMTAFFSEIE